MRISELLTQIRAHWIDHVAHLLSPGEEGRDFLLVELERFYDLLQQAIASGDPGWLKPLLIEWATARTESELLQEKISLSPVLDTLMTETPKVVTQVLGEEEALFLLKELMPIFTYAYSEIAQQEMLVRVGYISAKLDQVQTELRRIDHSKSDFISVAAHELKTPLTLIEGYAAMLRDQVGDDDSSGAMLLKGIGNGTTRLAEIINDMIDVSLIDNNLLSLNFQPTWINRLLEVLAKEMQPVIKERNQNLVIKEFSGSKQMTFADSERIYQALRNLLTNAIKYTPDGGTITIDGRELASLIEVTVKDTGIGIDQEDQIRIFEKFGLLGDIALHSSSKTKFKGGGPGLGLPITKGILEAHGGTIWVESLGYNEEDLPGSIFHVLLPILAESPDDKMAHLFEDYNKPSEN